MARVSELGFEECVELLRSGVVGHLSLTTPDGPHIVPVSYTVADGAVIVATSPYSVLGTYGLGNKIAFEVDDLDRETREGWSVVVRGQAHALDPVELRRVRETGIPHPWADGTRTMYLRIPWTELSGRRLGASDTATARTLGIA